MPLVFSVWSLLAVVQPLFFFELLPLQTRTLYCRWLVNFLNFSDKKDLSDSADHGSSALTRCSRGLFLVEFPPSLGPQGFFIPQNSPAFVFFPPCVEFLCDRQGSFAPPYFLPIFSFLPHPSRNPRLSGFFFLMKETLFCRFFAIGLVVTFWVCKFQYQLPWLRRKLLAITLCSISRPPCRNPLTRFSV